MAMDPRVQDLFAVLAESGLPDAVTSLGNELLTINCAQWQLEDQSRNSHCTGPELVALKRAIDESNRHRNRVIQDIDQVIVAEFRPPLYSTETHLHKNSESVGRLLDRLTISIIRQSRLEEAAQGSIEFEDKLNVVEGEFWYQVAILRSFMTSLRCGRASYSPEVDVKDYRPRDLGR